MTYVSGFDLVQARAECRANLTKIKSLVRNVTINFSAAKRVEPFPYISPPIVMCGKSAWTGRRDKAN
ncbi:hypothetical protein BBD42_15315 [Paenibacillus sp. BIHB 4019]|uniref:Uncharacterized protein n=1 Tax=Paenibacillus sp. BIHB 4019 TaxID=1870819 RepID=A0A1B2DJ10_9BACL|nr:hypothetical protein BBD42_15315 [Paenibacillus sp. BIHB 4019]